MAKRIIILEQISPRIYRYVLWADVPVPRQGIYAALAKPSAYKNADQDELTALATGQVVERVGEIEADTVASARTNLIATWTAFQNDISGTNIWSRYGTYWDGTGWTAGGVS